MTGLAVLWVTGRGKHISKVMIFKYKKTLVIVISFLIITITFVTHVKLVRLAEDRENLLRSLAFSAAYSGRILNSFDDLKEESYVAEYLEIDSKYLPIFPHPNIELVYNENYVTITEDSKYPVSIFRWKKLYHSELLPEK